MVRPAAGSPPDRRRDRLGPDADPLPEGAEARVAAQGVEERARLDPRPLGEVLGVGLGEVRVRLLELAEEAGELAAAEEEEAAVARVDVGRVGGEAAVDRPAIAALGPDLLDDGVDPAVAMVAALRRCDPTRQVGEAVMDQRLVSGIGNVYKSESLFLAGVDPWRAVGSVTEDEALEIGRIANELLAKGVRQRGRISTYEPPGRPPGLAPSGQKWVYRRQGHPCRRCGTRIRSRGQGDANRTTYWCPGCQS